MLVNYTVIAEYLIFVHGMFYCSLFEAKSNTAHISSYLK